MAFQNPVMLEWRTILENIMLPLEIVSTKMTKAEQKERANYLLDLVGLTGFGDKRPSELSGGMRQRASLCRALVHKPEVLILDEPFGALDAFTREDLWQTMHKVKEEEPFTGSSSPMTCASRSFGRSGRRPQPASGHDPIRAGRAQHRPPRPRPPLYAGSGGDAEHSAPPDRSGPRKGRCIMAYVPDLKPSTPGGSFLKALASRAVLAPIAAMVVFLVFGNCSSG